jgi:hypothetical protein
MQSPSGFDDSQARKVLQQAYPSTRVPKTFREFDRSGLPDFPKESVTLDLLSVLTEPSSSPGFPYRLLATRNGDLLESHGGLVVGAVRERLNRLLHCDLTDNVTADEMVRQGLCDPVKVFVKSEPHTTEKLRTGRYRLICSVSIVDNLIAKLLFSLQNNTEINIYDQIPSKPGMGLHDAGLQTIHEGVLSAGGELAEADISGWDWCMHHEDFLADLERRALLNGGHGSSWYRVAKAHYTAMSKKVFLLSNGEMYSQTVPGVMPSGWYNTSSTNSYVRCLDSVAVQLSAGINAGDVFVQAMGDDALERRVPSALAVNLYAERGKTCKMYEPVYDEFEFCSTVWPIDSWKGVPKNLTKLLFNLLTKKPSDDQRLILFSQFKDNIRHVDPTTKERLLMAVVTAGWL